MTRRLAFSTSLILLAAFSGVAAHANSRAELTLRHGKVYETPQAGPQTQGFVEIDNATSLPDTLTGVDCPVADTTLLVGQNGKPISQLAIAAGQQLTLSPNGPHIQIESTHFSIDSGGAIPCNLTFTNAGAIVVYLYATPAP